MSPGGGGRRRLRLQDHPGELDLGLLQLESPHCQGSAARRRKPFRTGSASDRGPRVGADCVDPAQHHRTVLGLAGPSGQRLRGASQIASRLSLMVRYADRSSTTRTRSLPEPTNDSPALAAGRAEPADRSDSSEREYVRSRSTQTTYCQLGGAIAISGPVIPARAAQCAADQACRRSGPDVIGGKQLRAVASRGGQAGGARDLDHYQQPGAQRLVSPLL
ncbi:hypothetical protein OG381_48080 [Streptomyces sp. NBC_00490]|uniref:DinB/UmuC family translesion DNA polymerase n=1 Tax=Streptomyces sp. NBC_00490 TaxID=2903657 RepID=UPI002E185A8C